MKRTLKWFIAKTKPLVWRIADAYDLRVDRPLHAYGQHPLLIEDAPEAARHKIPRSVYFNTRSGSIVVGANTVFGEFVQVLTGKHVNVEEAARDGLPLHAVPESGRDIRIGRDCYIGGNAILIGPLVIGDFAVVGAGAVVTRDVPPAAFVAGSPARIVRMLDGAAMIGVKGQQRLAEGA